jgi:hypothetical protein
MRTFVASFVIPLAILASSIAHAQDATALRYKAETGTKQYYSVTTSVKLEQKVNGQAVSTTIESTQILEREVMEPDSKGNMVLRDHTLHMTVKMNIGPLGEYVYDSKSTDNETGSTLGDALTPLYDAISGAYIDVVVSPQGEIVSVKGLRDAIQGAIRDNAIAAQFSAGMNSEEGEKLTYSEYFVRFPEKALTPGESWGIPYDMQLGKLGKLSGKARHTYEGVESHEGKQLHKVTSTLDISADIELKTGGIEVSGKVETDSSSGTAWFDAQSGRLISKTHESSTTGDLIRVAGGMTILIKQDQTQKVVVKLLDGPPPAE